MKVETRYTSERIRRAIVLILIVSAGILALAWIMPGLRRPLGTIFAVDQVAVAAAVKTPKPDDSATTTTMTAKTKETKPENVWVFQPDPLDSASSTLRERELKIQQREQDVSQAEARLERLRKEIELNLAKSEEVLKSMQRMAGEADTTRNKELKQWVAIYTAMKPAQAGPVIAGLDAGFALQILAQMDPKSAGKILENMPQAQAITLGQQLGLKHP
jgi:flagellar motility protein MotE (MotC chaperone)